ncbi:apyrase [Malassezia sp. CBS 17886]|nr:apyrase [Malassezia sp. CBS 17886]
MVYSWRDAEWERAYRVERGLPLDVLPTVEQGTPRDSAIDWQLKLEPGLSSFAHNLGGLPEYLETLFGHVREVIPAHALARTSVHVLATAGMRLLPAEHRQAILAETCRVLRTMHFYTGTGAADPDDVNSACGGDVRVISGEEEGLLGWIAVNYLMGGFCASNAELDGSDAGSASHTFGFLDMGGASTQIAFEPADAAPVAAQNETDAMPGTAITSRPDTFEVVFRNLDASTGRHQVFVTTFLGYGTNAARERYVDALVDTHAGPTVPGTPLGDPCLPRGLRMPTGRGDDVVGTGSYAGCLAQQRLLLDQQAACAEPPCLFHGIHVPAMDFARDKFIGVSEYWYSAHDVFDLGGLYNASQYHIAADAFCAEEWQVLEAKFRGRVFREQVTRSRLQMQCFKAAWVSTVLHDGLRLPRIRAADKAAAAAAGHPPFQSLNDVRGFGVSWALGQAVIEASRGVPSAPGLQLQLPAHGEFGDARIWRVDDGSQGVRAWASMGAVRRIVPAAILLALVVGCAYAIWRHVTRTGRAQAWTQLPTQEPRDPGSRRGSQWSDDTGDDVSIVIGDAPEEAGADDDAVARRVAGDGKRAKRSAARDKSLPRRVRRGFFARALRGTASFATAQLSRVVPARMLPSALVDAQAPILETRRRQAARAPPHCMRGASTSPRNGYALAQMSHTPTPMSAHSPALTPVLVPRSSTPFLGDMQISPTARLSMVAVRAASPNTDPSAVRAPHHLVFDVRRASAPDADPASQLQGSVSSSVLASGVVYGSRPPSRTSHPPSRVASPMLLEPRRLSVVPPSPAHSLASPVRAHRSPLSPAIPDDGEGE